LEVPPAEEWSRAGKTFPDLNAASRLAPGRGGVGYTDGPQAAFFIERMSQEPIVS